MPKLKNINREILQQVIAATTEPLLVVHIDSPDWPVVLANPAFETITTEAVLRQPFADVIDKLAGRALALEVSEAVRSQQETSLPIEANNHEYLLVLRPLKLPDEERPDFMWPTGVPGPEQARSKARKRTMRC